MGNTSKRDRRQRRRNEEMAKIHITNVVVLDNPSSFSNPFQFELTFECIEELKEDLEWKMIYVGSAESEDYDQVLDTIYVGPVPVGRHIFVFQADPPDVTRIPGTSLGVCVFDAIRQLKEYFVFVLLHFAFLFSRARCRWCNVCSIDVFISRPGVCSSWLFRE